MPSLCNPDENGGGVYRGFYKFSRDPFAAPADARHKFMAAGHRDALSGVVLDVLKRRPFVAVGGDGRYASRGWIIRA